MTPYWGVGGLENGHKGPFSIFEAIFSTFSKFTAQNKCAYQIQHTKIFKIANLQPSLNLVLCCVIGPLFGTTWWF